MNKIQQETEEFVSERIEAMKEELSKLPPTRRRSFDRACFLKPTLENDHGLYLMFLRADRFDAESAASKLCLHFDHKLELFGEAKLPKKITLEDLNEDDLEVFQSCAYIVLKKDRSGRQPQLLNMPRMKFKSWKNQVCLLHSTLAPPIPSLFADVVSSFFSRFATHGIRCSIFYLLTKTPRKMVL